MPKMKLTTRFLESIYTWGPLLALFLIWEVLVKILQPPTYLVPAPTLILATIIENTRVLLFHGWATLYEVLIGFGIGMAVGIPLAILIVYVPILEKTIYSLLVSANAIPKVALAPILVAWFGFGLLPKLIVAFLICFFPIVINTVIGMESISPQMLALSRSLGASRSQQFWKFRLPKALPSMFGGLKIGISLAVIGAVVGEYVAAQQGLGYLQVIAGGNLDIPLVFGILIILSLMGIILFNIVALIESLVIKGDPNRDKKKVQAAR